MARLYPELTGTSMINTGEFRRRSMLQSDGIRVLSTSSKIASGCALQIFTFANVFFNMTLSTKITYNFAHEYIARFHYFSMLINTISSSEYIWVIALLLHFLQMYAIQFV